MFRSTGLFNELMCPDAECSRPHCFFWHDPEATAGPSQVPAASLPSPVAPTYQPFPAQSDPYNPYSQEMTSFSGYSASIAQTADAASAYTGYMAEKSDEVESRPVPEYIPTKIAAEAPAPTSSAIVEDKIVKIKQEPVEEDDCVIVDPVVKVKLEPREEPVQPAVVKKTATRSLPLPKRQSRDESHEEVEPPRKKSTDSDDAPAGKIAKTTDRKGLPLSSLPSTAAKQSFESPDKCKNLLDCADYVSGIDAEIERLMSLRGRATQKAAELKGTGKKREQTKPVLEYVPTKVKAEVPAATYTPTPLAELEQKKEAKRRREEAKKVKVHRKSSSELSQEDLFGEDLVVAKKPRLVEQPAPSSSGLSAGVSKGVELTADQLLAAKQRIARPGAVPSRPAAPNRKIASAVEQMQARARAVEAQKAAAAASTSAPAVKKPMTLAEKFGESRPSIKQGRVARLPQTSGVPEVKPALQEPTNSKVPMLMRQQSLNKMYAELRTFLPADAAKTEAEKEEKLVLDKVKHKQGYLIAVVHSMKKIRDMRDGKSSTTASNKVSHDQVLMGKHYGKCTLNAKGPKLAVVVTEQKLYEALAENYLLTAEQLEKNSYPVWVSSSEVKIEPSYYDKKRYKKTFVPDFETGRVCVRCNKEFDVNLKGKVVKDTCVYHLKNKARLPGKIRNNEAKYPCCGGDDSVEGCCIATSHVFDTLRESELLKFVSTPKPAGTADPRSGRIFALDCEMVYTVWGPALARVTVVDFNENVVLDEIVKPAHPILDYNTTFSGITAEQLDTAKHTLESVMQKFFEMANSESILIGHSLESDLKAMRLVHKRVVDTSLLYPHRIDDQKKRGLRELCLDKLGKSIQDDIDGHDSKEDSVAALQLAIYKAKFDGKIK